MHFLDILSLCCCRVQSGLSLAECFLQLALFEPGRQMLSEDTTAMQMLHTMANDSGGRALTGDRLKAREYTYGAVIAIEGREQQPEDDESDGHVMVSCAFSCA